jgi:Xaa-Pro aminopeptidase
MQMLHAKILVMKQEFFAHNRRRLTQSIKGGLVVLTSYSRVQKTNDMAAAFTQEANFWYLTGIEEPDWCLIFDSSTNESWLVMPNISTVHAVFDGSLQPDEAKRISGVDRVLTQHDGQELLRRLARKHSVVYSVGQPPYASHFNFSLNPATAKNWSVLERTFDSVQDCRKELSKLRAIKQPEELSALQRAVDMSIDAFETIHSSMDAFKNEYEIEAEFEYRVKRAGASGLAYDSIVASSKNACTLHYVKNNAAIRKRQMVLLDMGASFAGYAADISRTYIKGEPTKRQREVHAAVELAHKQIVDLIAPGTKVESYQRNVDSIMTEALASINLASDEEALRTYFPHAISHGLGIDVHDSLGSPTFFEENMVLTVEPGIYIPEEGIGVRIEDDIVVTKTGRTNLSARLSTSL